MGWFGWFGNLIWQPRDDPRVSQVAEEVEAIKRDMGELRNRTAALEAFKRLSERGKI